MLSLRFSTRDEPTQPKTSSPCEVGGLDVDADPGFRDAGECKEFGGLGTRGEGAKLWGSLEAESEIEVKVGVMSYPKSLTATSMSG